MKPIIHDKKVLIGSLMILAGFALIVDRVLDISIIPYWIWTWQFLLITIGIISLLTSDKIAPGIILIAVGSYFLFPGLFRGTWIYHALFRSHLLFYLILIIIGFVMIINHGKLRSHRRYNGKTGDSEDTNDYLNEIAFFGGGDKIITSQNFKGGNLTTVFGGSDLNLIHAKLATGENAINVFTMFGGWGLIVPSEWNVKIEVFSVFGGISDKRIMGPGTVRDNTRTLVLKGFVMFGGGDIKSYK